MANWPTSMPDPMTSGYTETPPELTIRTEMEAGPANVRPITMEFRLDAVQMSDLDSFYLNDCSGGASAFTMNHPRTGVSGSFRFTGPPTYSPYMGNRWRAAVQLEQLP